MFAELLAGARSRVSGDRALEAVRSLTGFHRIQSSPGYDRAADWVAGRLEEHGLRVEVDRVPGDGRTRLLGQLMPEGWECREAWAFLVEGERRQPLCDFSEQPLSIVQRSDAMQGRFPLVALEDGTEDAHYHGREVRGAVVLTSGAVHRVHQLAVIDRGAAGLLSFGRRLLPPVRTAEHDVDSLSYTSFWWPEEPRRGWGFVLSPSAGAALRAQLAAGRKLEIEARIDSHFFATTIPLVSARIEGANAREVLVVSHLCHPQPGANDNASGAAANLESACAARAKVATVACPGPQLGMRWLWVPELTGTAAWLATDPGRAERIVSALNLDMVGEHQERCGSTFLLEHPPCFAASFAEELLRRIRKRADDWVPTYSGPGHYSMTRMAEVPYGGGSDHVVFLDPAVGVPCPMLIQWPDRYYHSSLDTVDKCDAGSLALAARCAATYSTFLAAAGPGELEWLTAAVARGARRRLLDAVDGSAEDRSIDREWTRANAALASLARIGVSERAREQARTRLASFAQAEGLEPGEAGASPRGSRPVRRLDAPLDFQRHLIPGFHRLEHQEREAWRSLEEEPDGLRVRDLAWLACDGRRTLGEISALVALERTPADASRVERFFELAARAGLTGWA